MAKNNRKKHQHIKTKKLQVGDLVAVVNQSDAMLTDTYLGAVGKVIKVICTGAGIGESTEHPAFLVEFPKQLKLEQNLFWREELDIRNRIALGPMILHKLS